MLRFQIPDCYKELIENYWFQNKEDCLSFDDIVDYLKNNDAFITDVIDKVEFIDYVDYIDECKITFDSGKPFISIDEFIKIKKIKI